MHDSIMLYVGFKDAAAMLKGCINDSPRSKMLQGRIIECWTRKIRKILSVEDLVPIIIMRL